MDGAAVAEEYDDDKDNVGRRCGRRVFEGNHRNHKIEIIKSKRVSVERQSRILHNKYEH